MNKENTFWAVCEVGGFIRIDVYGRAFIFGTRADARSAASLMQGVHVEKVEVL